MAHNPAEKDYIQRDAAAAATFIEEAVWIACWRTNCTAMVSAHDIGARSKVSQKKAAWTMADESADKKNGEINNQE